MKWMIRIYMALAVLFLIGLGLAIYFNCCFQLFSNENILVKTIDVAPNESLKIYHSPSNAVSQPTVFVMLYLAQGEKFLEAYEPFENLDSSYVANNTLYLFLSNRMGRKDTFSLPIPKK